MRLIRRRVGLIILVGLVLFAALSSGFALYYRLLYVFALALVGSLLWSWLNLRWLSVEVSRPHTRTQVGGTIEERVRIRNLSRWPKGWLEVEEVTDLPGHPSARVITLPGRGSRTFRLRTLCLKRGVYTLGPVQVTSGDPLGVARLQRHLGDQRKVVVYPRVVALPYLSLPLAVLPGEESLRRRSIQPTPMASSVRDYIIGDAVNRVHWPTTARLQKLMVKEFDLGLSATLWILADFQGQVQAGKDLDTTDEVAATIAGSVAARSLEMGMAVGLAVEGDQRYILPPDQAPQHLERILETLAQAKAEGQVPLSEAIPAVDERLSRYTTLLIITPSSRGPWLNMLASLRRRAVRIAVVHIDAGSFGSRFPASESLVKTLASHNIPLFEVKRGQSLAQALSTPLNGAHPEMVFMGAPVHPS